jgi:hypothetical protein
MKHHQTIIVDVKVDVAACIWALARLLAVIVLLLA